jgi:hypothetical protein
VTVNFGGNVKSGTWKATLKNRDTMPDTDVTHQILKVQTPPPPPGSVDVRDTFTGKLTLLPGKYTLVVSGDAWMAIRRVYVPLSASRAFSIDPVPQLNPTMSITLDAATVRVAPGSSVSVGIAVSGEHGFSAPVTVTTSDLPSGVTSQALTIPAGSTTGTFTLTGEPDADPTRSAASARVKASATQNGRTLISEKSLSVSVLRRTGEFKAGDPLMYLRTGSKRHASGNSEVNVVTISSYNSNTHFQATFKRLIPTAKTFPPLDFYQGPNSNYQGAALCPAAAGATWGSVLSAPGPNGAPVTGEYYFQFQDLTDKRRTGGGALGVNATRANDTVAVMPQIQFSPDCNLVLVLGKNRYGTTPCIITGRNLATGRDLEYVEVTACTLKAFVQTRASGEQFIRVDHDGRSSEIDLN